jgi:hypothetical protein
MSPITIVDKEGNIIPIPRKATTSLFPKPCEDELDGDEQICELCGSNVNIRRHHISYFPEKIIVLCNDCHTKVHHDLTFHPELQPPKEDASIYYGRKDPTTPLRIEMDIKNGIKVELLEIQNLLGLTEVSETIRFIINQYYKQIKLNKVWWDN